MSSIRSVAGAAISPIDPALERRWDRLAVEVGSPPFVRPGWLRAWAAAFGRASHLRLLTVERDGELAAALPLLAGRWALRSPTNSETPLFCPIAADAEAAGRLADLLLTAGRGVVDLDALAPQETASRTLLEEVAHSGVSVLRRPLRQSPYIDVGGDPAAFQRGLSKNRRHGLRRLTNRLRDAGEVTFEVHDGRAGLEGLLRDGFRLEARPWKRAAGSAILSRPAALRFYTAVARWAAAQDILRLAFLRLDGRPIAFGYTIQQHSTLYFLKLGMDDAYQRFGPGVVFTQRLIDHAFAQPGLTQLDLLGENEQYKADFASGTHEQLRLQIFPSRRIAPLQRAAAVSAAELRTYLVNRMSEQTRTRLSAVRNRLRR
ncbi:GNAT family N-acetyltransferase [Pseudonocardia hispaniensis]|uniref:GNAT family N-acetyltransferase n=1 Tax=Pseudonocardia hispaniensis TaxID=904933 RepID=A0ABW1IYS7_9PSEU